ncbi:hypothetical protein OG417_12690 [Actinoallomurus sp. NBC_01490]|uniref:hypothetical protein n=1 Tax=Actinoallomurus sp. NBC_01490 TaxID=2903557 RepID=UPI002E2F3C9E|nr:hypothetical protein [Actinoallomurus sp. NBC_01490]
MSEYELRRRMGDRRFWTDYFGATFEGAERYPELADISLSFPVDDEYGLVLEMREIEFRALMLRCPEAAEPACIAYLDEAHPMPLGLRWTELDLIGRCAAWDTPGLPHPGVAVALLAPFIPIVEGDDAGMAIALLQAALRHIAEAADPYGEFGTASAAGLPDRYVQTFMELCDLRDADLYWRHDPDAGWYLDQKSHGDRTLYSYRKLSNLDFPFAELKACEARARRRLADAPDPAWRTPDVVKLLGDITATGDLSATGSLLTALRKAGCDNATVLAALAEPVIPVQAC